MPASIETTPKQALDLADLGEMLPSGTRVYLPDIGGDREAEVRAARRLNDLGFVPVPHIAARRQAAPAGLRDRIARLAQEGGVSDMLVIGGDLATPAGDFSGSLQILETGFLDRFGITDLGVGGHPEGSRDFTDEVAMVTLQLKQAFAERSDARMRIVTQFGFNPEKIIAWSESLSLHGITLPVHVGVAGPASISTLIKYAAVCGVENSISFLKKQSRSLLTLTSSYSPEAVLVPIEEHYRRHARTSIVQMHVFPFGGVRPAVRWLQERGSWTTAAAAVQSGRS